MLLSAEKPSNSVIPAETDQPGSGCHISVCLRVDRASPTVVAVGGGFNGRGERREYGVASVKPCVPHLSSLDLHLRSIFHRIFHAILQRHHLPSSSGQRQSNHRKSRKYKRCLHILTFFSENTNTSRATRDNIIYISTLTQNYHHVLVKKLYTSVKNLDIYMDIMKSSKNNLHHLSHSFRSIFIFSSVVYLQYTPSSKRNLYSKIIDKSEAVYFFHVSYFQKSGTKVR